MSEKRAYSRWINKVLANDADCRQYLPLDPYGDDIYDKIQDGVILCKLLNISLPGAIDERTMNRGQRLLNYAQKMENLALVLNSARCHGCSMGNADINDIYAGVKYASIDFIWQVIRIGFLHDVNIHDHPEIVELKKVGDSLDDLREQSSHDIIIRYVNFHLSKSGMRNFVTDYDDDYKDCLVYAHLTYRVAPATIRGKMISPTNITRERCVEARARNIIRNLEELGAESFLTEDDLINGFERRDSSCKLHMATMGYLFKHFNGDLSVHRPVHRTRSHGGNGECLEELICRHFLNSFDVYPFCNHILNDCRNGWILGELFEVLRPGYTSGVKFILDFDSNRIHAQRVHNCTKIVKLAQNYVLNTPNLDAEKIADSDKSSILGLIVEMMRAYVCRDNYIEKEILDWSNCQLRKSGKQTMMRSFGDRIIAEDNLFAVVLESVAPGLVDRSCLGNNKLLNANYYVSISHKAGIPVYTLPEHFVEGNAKFVALAFATLMVY